MQYTDYKYFFRQSDLVLLQGTNYDKDALTGSGPLSYDGDSEDCDLVVYDAVCTISKTIMK